MGGLTDRWVDDVNGCHGWVCGFMDGSMKWMDAMYAWVGGWIGR